jgi:hypothetical protein
MAINAEQLADALDDLGPVCPRREPREQTVRVVEYTRFPRAGDDALPRFGFTRDISVSGMCIGADEPEPVGALLRVTMRDLDGQPRKPSVERVAWCSRARDGRHWIGLERLADT